MKVIWIGYTTTYREGGAKFERAAQTMSAEKRVEFPNYDVRCEAVNTKLAFVEALKSIANSASEIEELHFIGHSGMYGIMFRSTAMPEQFSPHEWRTLSIPFAAGARAYFHACRTARWFAPFFARTFGVQSYGYHWYTTISRSKTRFRWDGPLSRPPQPLYIVACPGRKSHGPLASLVKHTGMGQLERMKRFDPVTPSDKTGNQASYAGVARLYAEAFADIRVRRDELAWIQSKLRTSSPAVGMPRVLDLGCGSGSLLKALCPAISSGVGIDTSGAMLAEARKRCSNQAQLKFVEVDGPQLPFADGSFDLVISLLSFRYLDWDPIINEIRRVLKPGGRLLVVDMVTVPLRSREFPRAVFDKWRQIYGSRNNHSFRFTLRELVKHPSWGAMLKHNPIRSEHEFRWFLESRFPPNKVEVLNIGWSTRMLAFDSGPLAPGWSPPQSYP